MSELRIVRGTDIKLYVADTPIFGVTEINIVEKPLYHEVYEYLSTLPCERVPQGTGYVIHMKMMSLFDKQLPTEPGFILRVVDGRSSYCYYNCRITQRKTELKGNGSAVEAFTVEADRMRKRWARDE